MSPLFKGKCEIMPENDWLAFLFEKIRETGNFLGKNEREKMRPEDL